jgi:hypothetical protein
MAVRVRVSSARRRERDDHLASVPWVRRLAVAVRCDGIKWHRVALKHLYARGARPAEGIPDRARCTLDARWRYTALKGSWARTGAYCGVHLVAQFSADEREERRYQRWLARSSAPNAAAPEEVPRPQ